MSTEDKQFLKLLQILERLSVEDSTEKKLRWAIANQLLESVGMKRTGGVEV